MREDIKQILASQYDYPADEDESQELRLEIGQVLTKQYDYPPNGEGSIGYKGNNLYRFKVEDGYKIEQFLAERIGNYRHSYSIDILAQEIITDLLDQGLIVYGGYGFKRQQKEHHSI